MKILIYLYIALALVYTYADTPPPGTVKAKTFTGDGVTGITAHGTALDVTVTNTSGLTTVNQGTAGSQAWLTSLASLPSLAAGSNTIGNVNVNGTVPISGSVTATNPSVGATGSAAPSSATLSGGSDGVNLRALKVSSAGVLSVDGSAVTQPVSGTFWQATQPVSGTVTANAGTGTFTVDASGHTVPVSGTFWQATQPISAASLPLPSGAATSAKQPAIGTAGTASADVLTVQGIASMTALKVDGSAVTQPVSGTVTANAGTGTMNVSVQNASIPVTGTFWQATQPVSGTVTANIGSSGSLALDASVTGLQVAQGSTTSGQSGSLVQGAVTTGAPTYTTAKTSPLSLTTAGALRVDGSAVTQPVSGTFWQATQPVSGTFWQATQPVSIATAPVLVAGSAIIGKVGIDQTTPGTTNGVQVNAALPAGSNVIGHVIADASSAVIGHVIVDTAPTTAVSQSGTWTVNSKAATPTALTVKSAAITVGTSAVRLTNDGSAPASTRVLLIAQLLSTSTANCFLGPSGVTTTSTTRGIQMFAGQSFSFNNDAGDYYAICDASSQTFFVTEQE